jgi:DHA2 family multidrug resistance protein
MGQLATKLEGAGLSPAEIQAKLGLLIKQEAAILGLNDAFFVASFMFIGLGILVWFAHPTHLPLAPTRAEELRERRAEELIEEMP